MNTKKRKAHKMARTTARNIRSIHPVDCTMALQDQRLLAMTRHNTHPPPPPRHGKNEKNRVIAGKPGNDTVLAIQERFPAADSFRSINSRW
jgi:hypothetical protein